MIDEHWRAARRILAVRLDNLGDVLVTTPALHALKAALPGASLTLLASPVGAQAGRLNPDVDDVIVYQAPWMDPWRTLPHDSAREQDMIATIRARGFDAAVIFTSFRQSALPAAYLCYLAAVPLRLAASVDGPGSLLTTRHKHPERLMHEVERGLDLLGAIGIDPPADERALDLTLTVPERARVQAAALVSAHPADPRRPLAQPRARDRGLAAMPVIVVHPGCSMPARTYPWELYVAVVDLLVERLGALVVVSGAAGERELVERLLAALRPTTRRYTLDLIGADFATFCALIASADLTITNNTGPMHISAAVQTPVVALFALTNPPEQWGPWRVPHRQLYHDVPCRLCYSRVCPYAHECLRLVSPADVVDAAAGLLSLTSALTGEGGLSSGRSSEAAPATGRGVSQRASPSEPPFRGQPSEPLRGRGLSRCGAEQ